MDNKVTFGLKNTHYSVITESEDGIKYGTPTPIPGTVEISLDPRGDMSEFYADDILYYSAANNQGYDGTLTIANIPEQFAIDCLGELKDDTDMVITEKSNAVGKNFALMFEFDGDVKAVRHVLYNCSANRPTISSSTKTNTKEPNTNELTFVSSPRSTDLAVKTKTTATTPKSIYDNWYKKVYEKADTPLTVTVSPADEASNVEANSKIVWTFNKELEEESANASNFLVMKASGEEVSGSFKLESNKKAITFTPTSNLSNSTVYIATVVKTIKAIDGSALQANKIINFTTKA
ncbi:MAG: Ig-like domain-containing protein [Clostridium sp.]|uniref:major tail protein n=1 Tax=Clostridium TaxID=1485 RepID=UPI0028FFF4A9|nr:major tail protein [Clostridium sp.]MDU2285245.1 Ig-like domain-containing protein [Clostridium sp.]MDU6876345.1 Ig-like domain-containing protein [Clostridium sp.]MDU6937367.1 Ig-like domain-containing protein [Clostridium sp.]